MRSLLDNDPSAKLLLCAILELNLAIVCACMPTLRSSFIKLGTLFKRESSASKTSTIRTVFVTFGRRISGHNGSIAAVAPNARISIGSRGSNGVIGSAAEEHNRQGSKSNNSRPEASCSTQSQRKSKSGTMLDGEIEETITLTMVETKPFEEDMRKMGIRKDPRR